MSHSVAARVGLPEAKEIAFPPAAFRLRVRVGRAVLFGVPAEDRLDPVLAPLLVAMIASLREVVLVCVGSTIHHSQY
jgi:hypothetical protein